MNNNYYIGIDQSYTSTGLVMIDGKDNIITHEVFSTLKAEGDYFYRAAVLADSVSYKITSIYEYTDKQIYIALEGLAFSMRGMTLQNLSGLQFMLVNGIRAAGFDTRIYTPSTVKKIATGSGKADKSAMYEALPDNAKKMFGSIPKAHGREDLTDAFWIAKKLQEEIKKG